MFAITSAFRVVLGCAIIAAVAMMQTACSRQDKSSKRNIVLYVTLTTGNPFYEEMIAGLKAGIGNHRGWELQIQTGATADDASGQSQIMDSYLKLYFKTISIFWLLPNTFSLFEGKIPYLRVGFCSQRLQTLFYLQ